MRFRDAAGRAVPVEAVTIGPAWAGIGAGVGAPQGGTRSGSVRLGTGGWSTAMAAKSWMSRLRRVASQATQTWLGEMSLTWL